MLIPRLVNRIIKKQEIIVAGNEGIRVNPIYVKDFVDALIFLISRNSDGIFNACGDEIFSIKDIANTIVQVFDSIDYLQKRIMFSFH